MPDPSEVSPDTLAAIDQPKAATVTAGAPVATPSAETVDYINSAHDAALRAAMQQAVAINPDAHAKALNLADQHNLPADVVAANLPMVQQRAALQQMDLPQLKALHPELAKWMSSPDNAAIAHDDLPALKHLDRALTGLSAASTDDPLGLLPKGFRFATGPYGHGGIEESTGDGNAIFYGSLAEMDKELASRSESAFIDQIQRQADVARLERLSGVLPADFVAGAAANLASTQQAIGVGTPEGQQAAADLTAASQERSPGFGGDVMRGAGGLVADAPLMLAGGPIAEGATALMRINRTRAIIAGVTSARTARVAQGFIQAAASVQPLAIREGLSDAEQHGGASGLMNWAIETVIPGAFGKTGIQAALIPTLAKEAHVTGWLPAATHLLKEAGMEGTEEVTTELAHALYERASGQNPHALEWDQLGRRLAVAGTLGAAAGAAFNLPGAVIGKYEADAHNLSQSAHEAQALKTAFDAAQGTKVTERSPEHMRQLMQSGHENAMVFVQPQDFADHYTKKGADPEEMAARMGVDSAAYKAAVASGSALPIPQAGFLAHTVADDAPLLGKVTVRPDAIPADELKSASEKQRELFQGDVNKAKKEAESGVSPERKAMDAAREKIHTDVSQQLIAAGRTPETAQQEAHLVSEAIPNLANKFNEASRDQAEAEALATFKREHSGNEPTRSSDEWKATVAKAREAAPVVDPVELYKRYFKGIQRESEIAATSGKVLEEAAIIAKPRPLALVDAVGDTIGENVSVGRTTSTLDQNGNPLVQTYQKRIGGAWVDSAIREGIGPKELDKALEKLRNGKDITTTKAGRWIQDNQQMIIAEATVQRALADAFKRADAPPAPATEADRRIDEELNLFQGIVAAKGASLAFDDLVKQWRKANGDRTPVRNSEEWTNLVAAAAKVDAIRELAQPARAVIHIAPDHSFKIGFLEGADRSSFIHEVAHGYVEIMHSLAERSDAPDSIKADLATMRDFAGATDEKTPLTDEQHEKVAEAFETYIMEGKAPSSRLREAFARMKAWMARIYQSLVNMRVQLNPEIRGVFDRILASDEAIARAADELSNKSPWNSAAEAGMSEEKFRSYLGSIEYRQDRAADFVRAGLLKDQFEAESEERARERATVQRQMEAEIDGQPVYQAIRLLQDGLPPEGMTLEEMLGDSAPADDKLKLNKAELLKTYSEARVRELPGPKNVSNNKANQGRTLYTSEGGMALNDAATLFGYKSGDDLFNALTAAPDRDGAIQAKTDAEMAKRYPDPLVDGSLEILARGAMADQIAGHTLYAEVSALGKKLGEEVAPSEILKMAAERLIGRTAANQIRPETYYRAAITAGREGFEAAAKSRDGTPKQQAEWDRKAFDAKQKERFNLHLYRAALNAVEESKKGRDYLATFNTLDKRKRIGMSGGWEFTTYNPDGSVLGVFASVDEARNAARAVDGTYDRTNGYTESIDAILEGYDLRRKSLKQLRKDEQLRKWIARQQADSEPVNISGNVIEDLGKKNWYELTIDQQREVVDAVKNIDQLSMNKNRLLKSEAARTMKQAETEITKSLAENAKQTLTMQQLTDGFIPKAMKPIQSFLQSQQSVPYMAREMDGHEAEGFAWKYFVLPFNRAAGVQEDMNREETQIRDAAIKEWGKKAGLQQDIPGTKLRLNNEERIGLIANWGNVQGRQRVLASLLRMGGTEADVQAVIRSLDAKDVALLNATWKQMNRHWSDLKALDERTKGFGPEKVQPIPFDSPAGQLTGGYYTLKYQADLSAKPGDLDAQMEARQALNAAYGATKTRQGASEMRVDKLKSEVLRLDFGVVNEAVTDMVHDLTHREMLIDQGKLLRNPNIHNAIVTHYGKGAADLMLKRAVDVAVGDKPARTAAERSSRWIRGNTSFAAFAANVTSAATNLTGITQALTRVSPTYMAYATARVMRSVVTAEQSSQWCMDNSALMRNRGATLMREMREASQQVHAVSGMDTLKTWGYYPMNITQRVCDTVAFIGAYEQHMAKLKAEGVDAATAHERSISVAESTVTETMSSGRIGDLTDFQRGGEVAKIFSTFGSFMSAAFNQQRLANKRIKGNWDNPAELARFVSDTMIVSVLPAILSGLVGGWLRGDKEDKDLKETAIRNGLGVVAYGVAMLPVLRELSGAVQGYSYHGVAAWSAFNNISNLIVQAGQGKADKGLVRAAVTSAGSILGAPATELNRVVEALYAEDLSPLQRVRAAVFGTPR